MIKISNDLGLLKTLDSESVPTIVSDGGPWVKHNMPCAVEPSQKAVYDLGQGVFLPSWAAQRQGWMLIKPPKWLRWFLRRRND